MQVIDIKQVAANEKTVCLVVLWIIFQLLPQLNSRRVKERRVDNNRVCCIVSLPLKQRNEKKEKGKEEETQNETEVE